MRKWLIVIMIAIVVVSLTVVAVDYAHLELISNPDVWDEMTYVRTSNFSGENLTADNFFGNLNGSWNGSVNYVTIINWITNNGTRDEYVLSEDVRFNDSAKEYTDATEEWNTSKDMRLALNGSYTRFPYSNILEIETRNITADTSSNVRYEQHKGGHTFWG